MIPQLAKLQAAVTSELYTILPSLKTVTFEPHDWPSYIPYRLHIGYFNDPPNGAMNLPVWAYLRLNSNPRIPVAMELGAHQDLGEDQEENWDLFWENIRHPGEVEEPVQLIEPFEVERSRSDLFALVKYYFLLAADAGIFEGEGISYTDSLAQGLRAICRRLIRRRDGEDVAPSVCRSASAPEERAENAENGDQVSGRTNSTSSDRVSKRRFSDISSESGESDNYDNEVRENHSSASGEPRRGRDRIAKRIAVSRLRPWNRGDGDTGNGKAVKTESSSGPAQGDSPKDIPRAQNQSEVELPGVKQESVANIPSLPITTKPHAIAPKPSKKKVQESDPLVSKLDTFRLRSQVLNSYINSLRNEIAAKEEERRKVDAQLHVLIQQNSLDSVQAQGRPGDGQGGSG